MVYLTDYSYLLFVFAFYVYFTECPRLVSSMCVYNVCLFDGMPCLCLACVCNVCLFDGMPRLCLVCVCNVCVFDGMPTPYV